MRRRILSVVFVSVVLATTLPIGSGTGSRWIHFPIGRSQPGCSVIFRGTNQPFEAVDVLDSFKAWAVRKNDIWRTNNGGMDWTRVTPLGTRNQHPSVFSSIQAISEKDVWALGSTGLLHTTDSGNSWAP